MVSAILTCWRRFENFEKIIKAWLDEPKVNEIIIWDNSGTFKTDLPVTVISSNRNFGTSERYVMAAIIKNEIAMFCDDDIIPKPGFLDHLLAHYKPNRILGVTGRIFKDDYEDAVRNQIESFNIEAPVKVDFVVGYLMMTHRKNLLGFNYSNAARYCCELELFGRLKEQPERNVELYVVPTTLWEKFPEGDDDNALYRQPGALAEKKKIFERYWNKE